MTAGSEHLDRLAGADPAPRRVSVSRVLALDAASAFALVADVRNHERWIPVTRGTYPRTASGALPPGPFPVGTRFTMTSGPGFVDRMIVTAVSGDDDADPSAERSITLRKAGPLLLGTAGLVVTPLDPLTCRVTWWEDAYLAGPLPAHLTRAAVSPVLAQMMALALRRVGAEVAAARHGRDPLG